MSSEEPKKEDRAERMSSTEGTAVSVKESKPTPRPVPNKKAAPKEEVVLEPSPKEPLLQAFKAEIEKSASDSIEEAYINRIGEHTPTLVVKVSRWLEVATLLRKAPLLSFNYVRNLSAVDYTTHMEMVYVLYSFSNANQVAIRVKLDRENPVIPTVSHLWDAANWNERECYDLFGIVFENHPDLKRILMPDNWEGFPLRKDYDPLDKEV